MKCNICGNKIKANEKFCYYCGSKIELNTGQYSEKDKNQILLNILVYSSFIISFFPFHIIVLVISIVSGLIAVFLLFINRKKQNIKKDKLLYSFSLSGILLSIFWIILIYSTILD